MTVDKAMNRMLRSTTFNQAGIMSQLTPTNELWISQLSLQWPLRPITQLQKMPLNLPLVLPMGR